MTIIRKNRILQICLRGVNTELGRFTLAIEIQISKLDFYFIVPFPKILKMNLKNKESMGESGFFTFKIVKSYRDWDLSFLFQIAMHDYNWMIFSCARMVEKAQGEYFLMK